jgi:hypothetical protein
VGHLPRIDGLPGPGRAKCVSFRLSSNSSRPRYFCCGLRETHKLEMRPDDTRALAPAGCHALSEVNRYY